VCPRDRNYPKSVGSEVPTCFSWQHFALPNAGCERRAHLSASLLPRWIQLRLILSIRVSAMATQRRFRSEINFGGVAARAGHGCRRPRERIGARCLTVRPVVRSLAQTCSAARAHVIKTTFAYMYRTLPERTAGRNLQSPRPHPTASRSRRCPALRGGRPGPNFLDRAAGGRRNPIENAPWSSSKAFFTSPDQRASSQSARTSSKVFVLCASTLMM